MDFEYTPEQKAFRQEVQRWLEAHLTPDLCVDDAMDKRVAGDRETFERRVAWQKKLNAAGWVRLSWPKRYGGRGATLMEQIIFNEEYGRVRAWAAQGLRKRAKVQRQQGWGHIIESAKDKALERKRRVKR